MEHTQVKIGMLLVSMTISAVLLVVSAGNAMRQQKEIRVEKTAALAEKEPVGFMLKEYQGRVALFRENSQRPYQVLAIEVYLLPDADRQALEEGIFAGSEEELKKILEDWES